MILILVRERDDAITFYINKASLASTPRPKPTKGQFNEGEARRLAVTTRRDSRRKAGATALLCTTSLAPSLPAATHVPARARVLSSGHRFIHPNSCARTSRVPGMAQDGVAPALPIRASLIIHQVLPAHCFKNTRLSLSTACVRCWGSLICWDLGWGTASPARGQWGL